MDHLRLRNTAHQSISNNGSRALLRRPGQADRKCWASVIDYTGIEKLKLTNPTDRRALISAIARDSDEEIELVGPTVEDTLVILAKESDDEVETLRFYAPIGRIKPGDLTLLYDTKVHKA
jgi:hypothetical protein